MSIICSWTGVSEDTSTQVTSEYIKCKHWMCWKTKTTVFFMWSASWSTDWLIYLNFFILILIYFQLMTPGLNYEWLLLWDNTSSSITIQELSTGGKILLQLFFKIDGEGDRWQFEKKKLKIELSMLIDYSY